MKTPPTSYFIKKALDLKGGSQKPGHQAAGQLSLKHVLEIAKVLERAVSALIPVLTSRKATVVVSGLAH